MSKHRNVPSDRFQLPEHKHLVPAYGRATVGPIITGGLIGGRLVGAVNGYRRSLLAARNEEIRLRLDQYRVKQSHILRAMRQADSPDARYRMREAVEGINQQIADLL